jgi:hypothetical protein
METIETWQTMIAIYLGLEVDLGDPKERKCDVELE